MTEPALILPAVPQLSVEYDWKHRNSITSPDEAQIKNISVGLAGFTQNIQNFIDDNESAWALAGQGFRANRSNYPLDGYALVVEFDLLDTAAVGICLSETSDVITDNFNNDLNFNCLGVRYNSATSPPIT